MSGQRIAVVTGSSSGIGFETSVLLARNGFYTYATVHNLDDERSNWIAHITKKENRPLEVVKLDVDSDESVKDTINAITEKYDRIDVILNNAGYALGGALEETSMEEMRKQFETNFFGAVRMTPNPCLVSFEYYYYASACHTQFRTVDTSFLSYFQLNP